MAYEKLNLAKGDIWKAEHVAHMEEGIAQNDEKLVELSEEKIDKGNPAAYQQFVTDRDGKPVWEDKPFGSAKTHDDITWGTDFTGLESVKDSYGVSIYKLDIDVSGLTVKDFIGAVITWPRYCTAENLTSDGRPNSSKHTFANEDVSPDGKSICYMTTPNNESLILTHSQRYVFVESGAVFEKDGATYTPGLWVTNTEGEDLTIFFPAIITTIPEKYLPGYLQQGTCLIYYSPEEEFVEASMTLEEMMRYANNYVFVNISTQKSTAITESQVTYNPEIEGLELNINAYFVENGFDNPIKIRINDDGMSIVEEDAGPP